MRESGGLAAGLSGATLQIVTALSVIAVRIVAVRFGLRLPTLRQNWDA